MLKIKTTSLSLDKINPSDDNVYVNSYSDNYSDSDITQQSTDSDVSTGSNQLMAYFSEDREHLITAIVNMVIDIPKNKDSYVKVLSKKSKVHDNNNINMALCFINPNSYARLVELLEDQRELNLLTRARKIIVLLQQNILFDSFNEELIMFHRQLKKLSNQSLVDSLSSSLIKSLTMGESKDEFIETLKSPKKININWILLVGGTIIVSLLILRYRK